MTDQTEAKPGDADEPKTEVGTEEVHDLDRLRADGLLRNPTYQTSHVDTTGDNLIDLRTVAPVFEEARRDAVRHAADVFDPNTDTTDENVIGPDDPAEQDAAREAVIAEAATLPEKSDVVRGGDGHGQLPGTEGDVVVAEELPAATDEGAEVEEKPATPQATPGSSSATAPSE